MLDAVWPVRLSWVNTPVAALRDPIVAKKTRWWVWPNVRRKIIVTEELGSVGVVSFMSQASVSTLGLADEPKEPEVGDTNKRVAIENAK